MLLFVLVLCYVLSVKVFLVDWLHASEAKIEFADKVRVFDFLIQVADEGASGHVLAHVTDRVLL